jgi:Response regulators consisting of a CheY-like receiver domain and a winged-helix DNA-binding domain
LTTNPRLLKLVELYLTRSGYSVTACSSGGTAWEAFRQDPGRFRLLLVDLKLSDRPGDDLARDMLHVSPSLAVLICSGFPYDVSQLNGMPDRLASLLKPFTPAQLIKSVKFLFEQLEPDA